MSICNRLYESPLFAPIDTPLKSVNLFWLIGTKYFLRIITNSHHLGKYKIGRTSFCKDIQKDKAGWVLVPTEDVLEDIPEEIAEQLLFYLDLFV